MRYEKITVYTAIGDNLIKNTENYHTILFMVSEAIGLDDRQAAIIIERCQKEDKRLIFYYPPSEIDPSNWEEIGEIEDGCLYIG